MGQPSSLPDDFLRPGRVTAVEAADVPQRHVLLSSWMADTELRKDLTVWRVNCDFQRRGVWSGVKEIFEQLAPRTAAVAPHLAPAHDYELAMISPALRKSVTPHRLSLTDLASPEERVRLYPAERALRIVHGLVDMLVQWKQGFDETTWLIVCENFDRAGYLSTSFFAELMRRCGESARFALLLVGEPGIAELALEHFPGRAFISCPLSASRVDNSVDPEIARERAKALEKDLAGDESAIEEHLHDLMELWRQGNNLERALRWQLMAFATYTYRGFYQDALRLGDAAFANLRQVTRDSDDLRFRIINKLVSCYCAIDQPGRALALIEEEALGKVANPISRSYLYYLLAMLHVRYLPEKDLSLGAEYLGMGLQELHESDLPEGDLHFQVAFNRNGLALIRHRQKKYTEAIQLCRDSYQRLATHLAADKHRLHRSVLLYNIAQVYAAVGQYDEAVLHYGEALAIDENYSEYYNERGNALFALGRFEEALADYRRAIELSPPYPEVWTNSGQCHRALRQWHQARKCYGVALELAPRQPWVYVMRAECHEAEAQPEEAIRDYDAALAIDPMQSQILANRAVLHYQQGRLAESLEDLNRALALTRDNPHLYQNRAVALFDLGRNDEAAADLEAYLELLPNAEDRDDVLRRIDDLRSAPLVA